MEKPNQSERPLEHIISNIKHAISCDYPHETKRKPTCAIISSELHETLRQVGMITNPADKEPQRYFFREFPGIKVFREGEIYKNYDPSIVESARLMAIPFVLAHNGWIRKFKGIASYNLDNDPGAFVQGF